MPIFQLLRKRISTLFNYYRMLRNTDAFLKRLLRYGFANILKLNAAGDNHPGD